MYQYEYLCTYSIIHLGLCLVNSKAVRRRIDYVELKYSGQENLKSWASSSDKKLETELCQAQWELRPCWILLSWMINDEFLWKGFLMLLCPFPPTKRKMIMGRDLVKHNLTHSKDYVWLTSVFPVNSQTQMSLYPLFSINKNVLPIVMHNQ